MLSDPSVDVVTNRHPHHEPEEYERIGVNWLLDTAWPGDNWLPALRTALHLDP